MSKDRAVTLEDLTRLTGLSADTIEQAFQEAEAAGLIRRERSAAGFAVQFIDPATGKAVKPPKAKS